jgi:hypothetical protein
MRRLLRLIGNRYGVSLGLVVMVVAIVLVAKGFSGGSQPGPGGEPAPGASVTASYEPDDGEDSPPPPVTPSVSPGAPGPTTVAVDFAKAWLHHDGVSAQQWFDGQARYATADLKTQLSGVDPAAVPASTMTGEAALVPHDAGYAVVTIPVDSGVLTLRMLGVKGRWLVDGVDWERT